MSYIQTAYEYEAAYNRLRNKEYSKYHGYAYDGIWTIAFAIHLVDIKLRASNSKLSFQDFKYRDPTWAQLFRSALNDTTFIGVTVRENLHFFSPFPSLYLFSFSPFLHLHSFLFSFYSLNFSFFSLFLCFIMTFFCFSSLSLE